MFVDQFGKHIQFSQYPGLTFSSMEAAFGYFEAHAKLQKQRAIQANARPVDCATQQMWQFDNSLEPTNVRPLVHLPTPFLGQGGPCFKPAAETISQEPLRAPDPEPISSRSSLPEIPPYTLFAESTPHAQDIQAQTPVELPTKGLQSWPPVELPAEELQSSTVRSQAMNGFDLQAYLPSPEAPDQADTLVENHTTPHSDHNLLTPSSTSTDYGVLSQPQTSYGSYPLASSYSGTVLPQTLAQKDMRVLGVPLTADIDEYVPISCASLAPAWPSPLLISFWIHVGSGLVFGCEYCSTTSTVIKPLASKTGQLLHSN